MRWANVLTVYGKELRDLLRDRRTLVSMIVVPMLLMPGLTMMTLFIAHRVVAKAQSAVPVIMLIGGSDSPRTRAALAAYPRIRLVPATADWEKRITDKKVRAAVEIPEGFDAALQSGAPAKVVIYDYEGEMRSGLAVSDLRRFFTDYRERVVAARLRARGLPAQMVNPFAVATQNVAPAERVGGNLFGGMIPYFFLLLSFTGAMYPAIDLTAGEKERGTMETILCSPVGRIELVMGKFLMVLTASVGTVVCSLVSMVLTLLVGGAALGAHSAAAGGLMWGFSVPGSPLPAIDPWGLLAAVAMVAPVAVLFAALEFTIALFAKSYKEAQSYVSPLIIVIILPAVVGMLPGVELNTSLALVPILNVSLVSKELVSGVWHWHLIALIFGSTCVYAAAALAVAVRMFGREDVIFRA